MGNPVTHVELTTTDPAKAKEFYGKLFDWAMEDFPMGDGDMYTMFRPGEGTGGGIMKNPPGAPTAWTVYFAVDDAADATKKAKSFGATVLRDVTEVPGYGAFSIMTDPTGAVFAIWAAKRE